MSGYTYLNNDTLSDEEKNLSITEYLKKNNFVLNTMTFSKEKYAALKQYVLEGETHLKHAGLVAGTALAFAGFVSCMAHIFDFYLTRAVFDAFIFIVGGLSAVYEYNQSLLYIYISDFIHQELHLMVSPFGRSIVYIFIGLLLFTQNTWFQSTIGVIVITLGIYICYHMKNAEFALNRMKSQISDGQQLRLIFEQCDIDKNGSLDSTELALVCSKLGTKLNNDELEAAIAMINKNNDGKISFEEFQSWYSPGF